MSNDNVLCSNKRVENISDAISYLYRKELWHLNLKPNNVLLRERQKTIVCDFGYLPVGDKPVNLYGSPHLYGPLETWIHGVLSKVYVYSSNVWCIGIFAIEIFTMAIFIKRLYLYSVAYVIQTCKERTVFQIDETWFRHFGRKKEVGRCDNLNKIVFALDT